MDRERKISLEHHLRHGFELGAAIVASTQILIWMGREQTDWPMLASVTLTGLFAERGVRSLEKLLGERVLAGQVALMTAVMVLVAGFMHQAYMFVHVTYVDPLWILDAGGRMEAEQGLPRALEFMDRWRSPGYVLTVGVFWFGMKHWAFGFFLATIGIAEDPEGS